MKELRHSISGFDYRFKFDKKTCPDVIIFMTPIIYYNLIRFGGIVFLDVQKRQINEFS